MLFVFLFRFKFSSLLLLKKVNFAMEQQKCKSRKNVIDSHFQILQRIVILPIDSIFMVSYKLLLKSKASRPIFF